MDIILAPDVYVNASVAPGSEPDLVVQRVLGQHRGEGKATEWVLGRVAAMLAAVPAFRQDAIKPQIDLIRSFVKVVPGADKLGPDAWKDALVASAKAAGVSRVVTDHPDLLKLDTVDGVEFLSSDAWLLEATLPPPVPGS